MICPSMALCGKNNGFIKGKEFIRHFAIEEIITHFFL
jgi:hypothetical protein